MHLAGSINSDIGRWKNISPSSCESRPMVPSLQKFPPPVRAKSQSNTPDELLDPKRQSKLRCFLQALPRRRWKAPPMYHSSGWNPLLLKYPRKTSSLKLFKESTGKQLSASHSEWFWMLFLGSYHALVFCLVSVNYPILFFIWLFSCSKFEDLRHLHARNLPAQPLQQQQ